MEPRPTKKQLRQIASATLARLPLERISAAVCERLVTWSAWHKASRILFYWPLPREISLLDLLSQSLQVGKSVYLPKYAESDGKTESVALLPSLDRRYLRYSSWGTWESSLPAERDPHLEVLLLPGLAFDRRGRRLGRGLAFYDRLLHALPLADAITVGIVPEALLYDTLPCPSDPWDKPVNFLCTEANLTEAS